MDLAGAFVNELIAIIGYVVIFFGVYKVNQVASDIREIKDLVASARRNPVSAAPLSPALAPEIAKDLSAEDSAAAYAQSLLRAVNAQSHAAVGDTHEVR